MAPTFDQVFPVLYKGWDKASALADFNAGHWTNKAGAQQFMGGGSQSSSSQPQIATPQQAVNNVVQSSLDTWSKLVQDASKKFSDYQKSNPFSVDDVLKQKQGEAQEQLDPYYNEQLGNYLLGTQRKLDRGAQDSSDLLNELNGQTSYYTQDTQLKLDNALQSAREGYASNGLFDSGNRLRSEGLLSNESDLNLQNFLRGQNYKASQINLGQSRLQQDYGLGNLNGQNFSNAGSLDLSNPGVGTSVATDLRNLEREKTSEESTLASSLTKEAGQKYVTGFEASLPPEYQAASGSTDLLKQIGIYA